MMYNKKSRRGVAQIGSALPWGGRGRGFKSRHSDQSDLAVFLQGLFVIKFLDISTAAC